MNNTTKVPTAPTGFEPVVQESKSCALAVWRRGYFLFVRVRICTLHASFFRDILPNNNGLYLVCYVIVSTYSTIAQIIAASTNRTQILSPVVSEWSCWEPDTAKIINHLRSKNHTVYQNTHIYLHLLNHTQEDSLSILDNISFVFRHSVCIQYI